MGGIDRIRKSGHEGLDSVRALQVRILNEIGQQPHGYWQAEQYKRAAEEQIRAAKDRFREAAKETLEDNCRHSDVLLEKLRFEQGSIQQDRDFVDGLNERQRIWEN